MQNLVGGIQLTVCQYTILNQLECTGQSLPQATYAQLLEAIGFMYGETSTDFNLPTLARLLNGIRFNIVTNSTESSDDQCLGINVVGEISYMGDSNEHGQRRDWFAADGSWLQKDNYPLLFAAIGYTFGGSGDTFCLPNLPAIAASPIPRLVLKPLIRAGINTQNDGSGDSCYLGSVIEFAGAASTLSDSWSPCDGRILLISTNAPLFEIIGNQFGGVPDQSFALPKMESNHGTNYFICVMGDFPRHE